MATAKKPAAKKAAPKKAAAKKPAAKKVAAKKPAAKKAAAKKPAQEEMVTVKWDGKTKSIPKSKYADYQKAAERYPERVK